jgi:uncharacterized DUF497 family protein
MCYIRIVTIFIKGLIWDDWNKEHIAKHGIDPTEVEEVCHGKVKTSESYRKRILILGITRKGRELAIVLSPEDRNLTVYGEGVYYLITAFDKKEVKK